MEENRLLDAHEAPVGDQELEELVLLGALDPEPAQGFLGARGGGPRPAKIGLEAVDHALLVGGEADLVRGEPHLVTLAPHEALGLEGGHELGEDLLLRVPGAAPELLPRDPATQRVLGMKGLEE